MADQIETSQNIPLFAALEQVIRKTKFGTVNLSLQVHDSKAVYLVGNNFEQRQYKDDGTTQAVEEALVRLKEARVKAKTGTFTVTFKFHQGSVKELLLQSNFKNTLT